MSDRHDLAIEIFQGLVAADGLDGGVNHLTSLAKLSFTAADAFIAVRDELGERPAPSLRAR